MKNFLFILAIWIIASISSTNEFFDMKYNKNPIKSMWINYDKLNYNFAGKLILVLLNTLVGLPGILICLLFFLMVGCLQWVKNMFDTIFKSKNK
jgi:hypothetical protein